MNYKIITAIGLAGSTLAALFGGRDKFLQTLLLFMAVDWLTGGDPPPGGLWEKPEIGEGDAGEPGRVERAVPEGDDALLRADRGKAGCSDGNGLPEGRGMYRVHCQ